MYATDASVVVNSERREHTMHDCVFVEFVQVVFSVYG